MESSENPLHSLEGTDNRSTMNNVSQFDGQSLLLQDPLQAYIYLAAVSFSIVFGLFGNIMIIVECIFYKMLHKSGYPAIVNLAIADLLISGIADPMCIVGVVKGKDFFDRNFILCEMTAMICLSACICSLLSLCFYTLLTYTFVCHNRIYYKVFEKKWIMIGGCVLAWLLAVAFEIPNMLGWGDHIFDEKNHQCTWSRTSSPSYSYFLTVALVLSPLLIMLAAYIHIFITIWRTKGDLLQMSGNQGLLLFKKQWQETFNTSRTMIIIVIAFLVCWTPYCVVVIIDLSDRLPMWVHLWATFLAHFHSVVNFYIYLATQKDYRAGFIFIMKRLIHCKNNAWNFVMTDNRSGSLTESNESTPTMIPMNIISVQRDGSTNEDQIPSSIK